LSDGDFPEQELGSFCCWQEESGRTCLKLSQTPKNSGKAILLDFEVKVLEISKTRGGIEQQALLAPLLVLRLDSTLDPGSRS
jgi:hypothetical protein